MRTLRKSPRFVPTRSVTVAVLDHHLPFAYGVAINISEGGARVQTGEVATRRNRRSIDMMLSFSNGEILELRGRIVWSKPLEDSSQLYGIEFTGLSEGMRETLRTVLDSPAVTAPG